MRARTQPPHEPQSPGGPTLDEAPAAAVAAAPPAPSPQRCSDPVCGAVVAAGQTTCPYCGSPVVRAIGVVRPAALVLRFPWGAVRVEPTEPLDLGREVGPVDLRQRLAEYGNVSRAHATVRHMPTGWAIVDTGSTNGTFLDRNPNRIPPHVELPLANGSLIGLGARLSVTVELS